MESRTYLQNLPYFDRLDYVAPMNQECLVSGNRAADRRAGAASGHLIGCCIPRSGGC